MDETTTPDHRSERTKSLSRIAAARATRVAVDHNGKPKSAAKTYTYDAAGRLIATDAAEGETATP